MGGGFGGAGLAPLSAGRLEKQRGKRKKREEKKKGGAKSSLSSAPL